MIARLNFDAPPPDFDLTSLSRSLTRTVETAGVWGPAALAAAWALHEATHEPPGLRIMERTESDGFYWATPDRSMRDAGFPSSRATAMSRAWAWYRECRKLDAELRTIDVTRPHTCVFLQAVEWWPRCLDLSAERVQQVRTWLTTGEGLPPALGVFELAKAVAEQVARAAVNVFLREQQDAGQMIMHTDDGYAACSAAAMMALDKLEPGRWGVEIKRSLQIEERRDSMLLSLNLTRGAR